MEKGNSCFFEQDEFAYAGKILLATCKEEKDFFLIGHLVFYLLEQNKKGNTNISYERIAKDTVLSYATVQKYMTFLADIGAVEKRNAYIKTNLNFKLKEQQQNVQ